MLLLVVVLIWTVLLGVVPTVWALQPATALTLAQEVENSTRARILVSCYSCCNWLPNCIISCRTVVVFGIFYMVSVVFARTSVRLVV